MMEGYSQEYWRLRRIIIRAFELCEEELLNDAYEQILRADLVDDEMMDLMNLHLDIIENLGWI